MNKFRVALLLVMGMLLVAGTALAQTATTGAITGTVAQAGTPLPGVTLEVKSPALQGTRTEVTDAQGHFRFSLLPPGQYTLTSTLSGFNSVTQKDIAVGLNRTVTLEVAMSPQVSEQITVTGAAPVVDITSTSSGANVTSETMQSLPMARSYVAAAQVAPGTRNDAVGTTVYGSSGAENNYIIDGLNTTGVRSGTQGKEVNLDFVQEVQTQTGGENAEYGRLTGGVINAITKSGGNEFTGAVTGFDQPKSLRADNNTFGKRSILASSVTETNKSQYDYGANLGGFFVKDRIWFFGAFDHQQGTDLNTRINKPLSLPNFSLPVGASIESKNKENLYAGKLTFRLTESQNIALSVFGDPSTTNGPIFAIAGPPSTFMGSLKTGGSDFTGRYAGVFGTNFVANVDAGRHKEKSIVGGAGRNIPGTIDATVTPNVTSGGFGFFADQKYSRDQAKANVSYFLGSHELKLGGEYYDVKGELANYQGGAGQRIYKFSTGGTVFYRHRFYVDDTKPGFVRTDPSTWSLAVPQVTSPQSLSNAAFLQDSWRMLPNLSINLGVRWESQEVKGRTGTAFKLDNNWAPRLGVIWDVQNNGRSKAYANYGRYFEDIPMDINIRAFGGELVCFCYNFSSDPANWQPDATAPRRSSILGSSVEPVDPNLKGQHIDEYLAGYDQEIRPNLSVGIKGTYRKLGNVIEDMLIGTTGEYLIANPGSGIGREAGFYEGGNVVTPAAKRTFKGVELHAEKRFSNNTQFFASYLWSRLEGNYDGTFQASTGQLDPNINSAFDYADFIVNNHGLLSSDRTHQVKFNGSYTFSSGPAKGLDIGLATRYASGTPLTANGFSFAYNNWEYYLTTRGALGRGPADYEADLHFGYPVQTGVARVTVIADIFNVLNLQRKTSLDTRYNRNLADDVCAGFIVPAGKTIDDVCTADGGLKTTAGTINPVSAVNPNAAPNPTFLKGGTQFTQPRIIRLGARVTF
jgi:hypothetical protein